MLLPEEEPVAPEAVPEDPEEAWAEDPEEAAREAAWAEAPEEAEDAVNLVSNGLIFC